MTYLSVKDNLLEIAQGHVSGTKSIRRVGINTDLDAGVEEDVWSPGGTRTWNTSTLLTLQALSSSASDDFGSTGLITLNITGIGASYGETTFVASLNGTTPENFSSQLYYVDQAVIASSGSAGTNVGNITIQESEGGVYGYAPAGYGQIYSASYWVPAGKTGYLIDWSSSMWKAVSGSIEVKLMICEWNKGWRVEAIKELTQTGTGISNANISKEMMVVLPEKTRVNVRATSSVNNAGLISSLTIITVNN